MGNKYQKSVRQSRVESEIRQALAEILRHEVNDPRLKQITLIEVDISRDLSHAKVYYTLSQMHTAEAASEDLQKPIHKALGFIRSRLGQKMQLRIVPALKFILDRLPEQASELDALIAKALKS